MRAAIITVAILFGVAEAYGQTVVSDVPTMGEEVYVDGAVAAPVAKAGHVNSATGKTWLGDWFGPMPQTCYQPRFGCYPGNPRTIHRYPAFHGYYYRAPYNYRHYFEYPWHAQPHEPQAFSSGGAAVVEESITPLPDSTLHAE